MIELYAIHSTNTYGGCLDGRPSPEEMLDTDKQKAFRLFGERAIFVIDPTITNGSLPPCRHIILLNSDKSIPVAEDEKDADGSNLLLVYYNNTLQSDHSMLVKSFNDNVEEWNCLASNFWY